MYLYGNTTNKVTSDTATCLDVCIINLNTHEVFSGIFTHDLSDHLPIFCFTPFLKKKQTQRSGYSYRKIEKDSLRKFRDLITAIDWNSEYVVRDPNIAYASFSKKSLKYVMTLPSHLK
ncbi:unnamed protein product [Ixodes pacificus]